MESFLLIIFFAILMLEPFFLTIYEGKKSPYSGVLILKKMSRLDLNSERVLSVLSNKLKEDGDKGIRLAWLIMKDYWRFFFSCFTKKETEESSSTSVLSVRILKSEFDHSKNGSLKKALESVNTITVNGKRLVFNVNDEDKYQVFDMSIWGYIRLRFANVIEKPFSSNKNAHKIQILLPAPGAKLCLAGSDFRTIFSIQDTDYNKSAGIKRLLENVKKDYQNAEIERSFEYSIGEDKVVLRTIR